MRANRVLFLLILLILGYVAYLRISSQTRATQRELEQKSEIRRLLAEKSALINKAQEREREADELRRGPAHLALSPPPESLEPLPADGPIARVDRLKHYLALHPERSIPEFKYLKDDEWLQITKDQPLDSEANERSALEQLRQLAKQDFGRQMLTAVKAYSAAHDGQTPADPSQLAPYLADPNDASLLSRYEQATPNKTQSMIAPNDGQSWLYIERGSVDDWYDSTMAITGTGAIGLSGKMPGWTVETAWADYVKKTGQKPTDPSQLIPYLKTPVDQGILTAVFAGLQPSQANSQ